MQFAGFRGATVEAIKARPYVDAERNVLSAWLFTGIRSPAYLQRRDIVRVVIDWGELFSQWPGMLLFHGDLTALHRTKNSVKTWTGLGRTSAMVFVLFMLDLSQDGGR